MPKKVRLNMKSLKVQSFVTSLGEDSQEKVKGGIPRTCRSCVEDCSVTFYWVCPPTATVEGCATGCQIC